MKNKFIIAGNWKMNTTVFEAKELSKTISENEKSENNVEIVLFPPFVNIPIVIDSLPNEKIKIGAQNCHYQQSGAYTGEISAIMLKKIGCDYVIIGHSERRAFFGEDNQLINKKIRVSLESGLKVVFCIGETLDERKADKTFPVLGDQISEGLSNIDTELLKNLVIAYEPVWAIGTGETATPDQIKTTHNRIRDFITERSGKIGIETPILYGGSMKDTNAKEILEVENVAGGLIGGASLKSDKFLKIINIADKLLKY